MAQSCRYLWLLPLSTLFGVVTSFVPPFTMSSMPVYDAVDAMEHTCTVSTASKSRLVDATNFLVSAEGSESVHTGLINWENPGEAFAGAVTLLYIGFSILAGIKYVVIDGWRPKL